mgnify:CR=1 FL=1
MRKPDAPAFSRTGRSSVFGKRTVSLSTKVTEDTAAEIRKIAREAGMTDSEFIAEVLDVRAFGQEELRRLLLERLSVVSGKAPI